MRKNCKRLNSKPYRATGLLPKATSCLVGLIIGILIGLLILKDHEPKKFLSPIGNPVSVEVPRESFEQRRVRQISAYLKKYQTPLKKDIPSIVMYGVSNRIDPALIVAVARKESSLCVRSRDFNCFGIGGASGLWSFKSYLDGVERFAKLVGTEEPYKKFRQSGDYYDLAVRYCPPYNNKGEPECDTKGWAKEVEGYVKEIEKI